jgi:replicative DNA helicase
MVENGDLSFISSDEEDLQWMIDFAAGKIKVGLTTGDEAMDEHFLYKRDFTIINGISNVGKTSFALYMIVNSAMRHGWKWLIYSAENKTASIKMKLLQYAMGRTIQRLTAGEIKYAMEWIGKHFIVISNREVVSYTDLMIYAERLMANDMNFDAFFIDPYNALKIEMANGASISTHEYHYEAASELLTFSNSNGKALWLNVHAFTEAQRKLGEDGYVVAPQAPDTEGGGKFVNRADNFLTFHRKVSHDEPNMKRTMEFHVRKIRETETGGCPTGDSQPLNWRMSLDGTSFINSKGDKLFTPLEIEEKQSEMNLEKWGL